MADKKITDLQQVSDITDDLNFPVDDTLQTYRGTIGQIKNYLAPIYIPPSQQIFTSGSGTYNLGHAFIVSGANATVGATYTNNGNTYIVLRTVSSSNLVWLSGSAAPTTSGTLTKASGTGDSTIAFSAYRKSIYLRVRMVGGGGGGSGTGSASVGSAGGGGATTFGTSLLTASGGGAGVYRGGASGGSATINSPASGIGMSGAASGGIIDPPSTAQVLGGFPGAASFFGGAGSGSSYNDAGQDAKANSGSGGGGGGNNNRNDVSPGCGGGAGAFIDAIIPSPSFTYAYAVGAAGTAGTAGTNGKNGGAGAAGLIEVTEFYQ